MAAVQNDVFKAIADPTRREIIHLLSKKPLTLNAVAGHFDISRPAISRHVKILTLADLVLVRQQGRQRYCAVHFRQLQRVSNWVDQYRQFWTRKLDSLQSLLENEKASGSGRKKQKRSKKKTRKS